MDVWMDEFDAHLQIPAAHRVAALRRAPLQALPRPPDAPMPPLAPQQRTRQQAQLLGSSPRWPLLCCAAGPPACLLRAARCCVQLRLPIHELRGTVPARRRLNLHTSRGMSSTGTGSRTRRGGAAEAAAAHARRLLAAPLARPPPPPSAPRPALQAPPREPALPDRCAAAEHACAPLPCRHPPRPPTAPPRTARRTQRGRPPRRQGRHLPRHSWPAGLWQEHNTRKAKDDASGLHKHGKNTIKAGQNMDISKAASMLGIRAKAALRVE
eukprot:355669-Chlamydomonas_euryale.AAC.2